MLFLSQLAFATLPFWTQITQQGDIPRPLWNGGSGYNQEQSKFYIFGGQNGTFPADFIVNDFSVFDVATSTWTTLPSSTGPSPRADSMTWVDKAGAVFVAGGRGRFRTGTDLTLNDTWAFDPEDLDWNQIDQTRAQEITANRSTGVVVAKNGRPYVFSGSRSTLAGYINRPGAIQTNVATFKSSNWLGWQNVSTVSASTPVGRSFHSIGYSAQLSSIFVYGGYTSDPNGGLFTSANYLDDLWRFDIDTNIWTKYSFNVTQSPGKRDNMKMVVDDKNGRIWGIGGGDWTGTVFSDVWYFELSSSTWTQVDIVGSLPPATIGTFHFDREVTNAYELYIFGGSLSEFGGDLTNDMWKLTIPN